MLWERLQIQLRTSRLPPLRDQKPERYSTPGDKNTGQISWLDLQRRSSGFISRQCQKAETERSFERM